MGLLGLDFEASAPDIDEETEEKRLFGSPPAAVAIAVAMEKARAIIRGHPDATVVSADTMVVLAGRSLGKPKDGRDALAMLSDLAGKPHDVVTGVVVGHDETWRSTAVTTRVTMRDAPRDELEAYVRSEEPLDKAGAYGIQGQGGSLVEAVEGCYLNVVGFPLCAVSALLTQTGALDIGDPAAFCAAAAETFSVEGDKQKQGRSFLGSHPLMSQSAEALTHRRTLLRRTVHP
jgi:septum formation protein